MCHITAAQLGPAPTWPPRLQSAAGQSFGQLLPRLREPRSGDRCSVEGDVPRELQDVGREDVQVGQGDGALPCQAAEVLHQDAVKHLQPGSPSGSKSGCCSGEAMLDAALVDAELMYQPGQPAEVTIGDEVGANCLPCWC